MCLNTNTMHYCQLKLNAKKRKCKPIKRYKQVAKAQLSRKLLLT